MSSNLNTVDWSFYKKNGFTPLVNVSGTMTSIGASIIVADAQLAMQLISPHFIKIHELQLSASKIINVFFKLFKRFSIFKFIHISANRCAVF